MPKGILITLKKQSQYKEYCGGNLAKMKPKAAANITLRIPDKPLKGSNWEATLKPKQSIKVGAKRISIALSVPPNKTILMINPTLEITRDENILEPRSKMMKSMMANGGPFLSASNPQRIPKIAELKIITIIPILIKWSSCKNGI